MNTFDKPKPCTVHTFKHTPAQWEGGVCVAQKKTELIPSYTGLLWGFGEEGDSDEHCICALVEKPDGTFDTPVASAVKLDTPTTLSER